MGRILDYIAHETNGKCFTSKRGEKMSISHGDFLPTLLYSNIYAPAIK